MKKRQLRLNLAMPLDQGVRQWLRWAAKTQSENVPDKKNESRLVMLLDLACAKNPSDFLIDPWASRVCARQQCCVALEMFRLQYQ